MADSIIEVNGLSKRFRRYHPGRPWTLQEAILGGLRRMTPVEYLWALRDVSFTVPSGCMLGVIGPNGAGKSTLLRLIGGVGKPDGGSVKIRGRIGALLDLGAGFHPDLTGRENVFVSGVISGLTRREVAERFDSIVDFSELEEFIESPIHTYSTGMKMRLAFAIAVHTEADIFLIDEVLAVGDLSFQRKCLDHITQLKARGCTIILVSHDNSKIIEVCDEAIWLNAGRLMAHGPTHKVVDQYIFEVEVETRKRTPSVWPVLSTPKGTVLRVNENRLGSMELEIIGVGLLDQKLNPVVELNCGDPLRIEMVYSAQEPLHSPNFTVAIRREDGLICFESSTSTESLDMPIVHGKGQISLFLERVDLNVGLYYVNIAVYNSAWTYTYDSHWDVYPIKIRPTGHKGGIINSPHRWEIGGEQKLQVTAPIR